MGTEKGNNGMKNIWQLILSGVVCGLLGSLITALSFQTTIVGELNGNLKDVSYIKQQIDNEINERKFSDSQLEAHLGQLTDLIGKQTDQNSQLIALIRAQYQLNKTQ